MKLVLAMDLRQNLVVHGKRATVRHINRLTWGAFSDGRPGGFVESHQTQVSLHC